MTNKDPFDIPVDPNVEGNNLMTGYNDSDSVELDEYERVIKNYILLKLGHPVVRVELTDLQIQSIIEEAINEMSPWVVIPSYITLPTASRIDVTEYSIEYVINVLPSSSRDGNSNNNSVDPFGNLMNTMFTNSINSSSRGGRFHDIVYANAEYKIMDQMMQDMDNHITWDYYTDILSKRKYLLLDLGVNNTSFVTIMYSPKVKLEYLLEDEDYKMYIKRFSLAFARETLANIRSKYTVDGSPITLDGDSQDSKSSEELSRLRDELRSTVESQFIID